MSANPCQLFFNPTQQFLDLNGDPAAGFSLYSYAAGTSTPQATYTDELGQTPNANPLVLDSNGCGVVWLAQDAYKFILKDTSGNTIWTVDNVSSINPNSITADQIANGAIGTNQIAAGGVETANIATAAITTTKIASEAVTTEQIAAGAIGPEEIALISSVTFPDAGHPAFGQGPAAVAMLPWSAPSQLSGPAVGPAGNGLSAAWSPNGRILAIAEDSSSFASLYARFGANMFKMAGFDVAPSAQGNNVAWGLGGEFISVASATSPYINIYQRMGDTFAAVNPSFTTPTGQGNGSAWSPDGRFLAIAHNTSPYVTILGRSGVYQNGGKVRYVSVNGQTIVKSTQQIVNFEVLNIDNLSAVATGSSWAFTAQRSNGYTVSARVTLASAPGTSATLLLYKNGSPFASLGSTVAGELTIGGSTWVPCFAGDTLSIYVNLVSTGNIALSTSLGSNHVSITEDSGYLSLSQFSKVTNPSNLPAGNGQCVAWSPDGTMLAVGHTTSPYLTIYSVSGVTFTKLTNPNTLPAGQVNGLAWSPDGLNLVCAVNVTPYILSYLYDAGTFIAMANPTTLPAGAASGATFSPNSLNVAVTHANSPYVSIYSNNLGTLTYLIAPSALPAGSGGGCSWSPDGRFLAVANATSPYMTIYETGSAPFGGLTGGSPILYATEVNTQ